MKLITAIVRPEKLESIREGLESGPARPVEARYWAAKRAKLRTAASKRPAKA